MVFDGTAIYVLLILANTSDLNITTGATNCVFKLDGATVGSFRHKFSTTDNSISSRFGNGHSFLEYELVNATENLQNNAYLNIDCAIYIHQDNASSTSTSSATASY